VYLGVGLCCLGEKFFHVARVLGHCVRDELQRWRELDAGLLADLAADHAGGRLERHRGRRLLRLVTEDGVEHRRLAQIGGHPGIRDRHESQSGVLDLELERARHNLLDPFGEPTGACLSHHRRCSSCASPALLTEPSTKRDPPLLLRAHLFTHLEGLDDVIDLHVAVVAEVDTAFIAFANLSRVVLEAAEGRHREIVRHHDSITHQSRLGVAADLATLDQAAGDRAELRRLEDLADLGGAELTSSNSGFSMPLRAASTSSIAW
jgi:hypothetical protein